jgi:hypothetical protein
LRYSFTSFFRVFPTVTVPAEEPVSTYQHPCRRGSDHFGWVGHTRRDEVFVALTILTRGKVTVCALVHKVSEREPLVVHYRTDTQKRIRYRRVI